MPRQLAGRDQNCIKGDVADRRLRVGAEPDFRCRHDALLLPGRDGLSRLIEAGPRFHLDENQQMAARGDDVDFAERTFTAPRQNAETVRDEPGGAAFRRNADAEAACRSGLASGFATGLRPRGVSSRIAGIFR